MSSYYLRSVGFTKAAGAELSHWTLGRGGLGFAACELIERRGPEDVLRRRLSCAQWPETLSNETAEARAAYEGTLATLQRGCWEFAGLLLDRPQVMGIINVTPDSFSDGGDRFDAQVAIDSGFAMAEAGASILDIGGESTRPGAAPVSLAEELARVLPVIEGLHGVAAKISIDSRHAEVMAAALDAGATLINDVTALAGDPASLVLAAERQVPVVLMHMRGTPETMQREPHYDDVALDVYDYLAERVAACEAAGIERRNIAVDPGIGFGKTLNHNLRLLDQLALFHGLGCPVLLGVSRKAFIGRLSGGVVAKARFPGSLAAGLAGVARGAQILRVHDVAETVQALQVWQAIDDAIDDEGVLPQ